MYSTKKTLATATAVAVTAALAIGLTTAPAPARLSGDLKLYLHSSLVHPQATMADMVERFQAQHPDLNIDLQVIDWKSYHTQLGDIMLADPPDAVSWMAGKYMMGPYIDSGLLADISDLWQGELAAELATAKAQSTQDGKQYAVPYSYYLMGVYYREDLYREYGLAEPTSWEELKSNCQVMLDNGHKCYAIGSLETRAVWFDYLNVRTNGYDFHNELAAGKVPWTDDRVRQTFMNWRELVDMGAFLDVDADHSWPEAVPYMVTGEVGAFLHLSTALGQLLAAGLTEDQVGFHQFPEITPGMPMGEFVMIDTFHMPSSAQNKANAREFLKFIASADNQSLVNEQLGRLPVNVASSVLDNKYLDEGLDLLDDAPVLAQLFVASTPGEMSEAAMDGFQEFMTKPNRLERVLNRLERTRKGAY